MSLPYSLERRLSPREIYLKVFLRDDSEAEKLRNLIDCLKSVRKANTTPSQSSAHPGMTLTVYGKPMYEISEVEDEVKHCLDAYFGNGQNKKFDKQTQTDAKFKGIEQQILDELEKANAMIDVCVAWFTNPKLRAKLVEKANEGVKVRVLVFDDYTNVHHGVDLANIPNLEYRRINADKKSGIMHQKFCVVDNNDVIIGSYNWSTNAEYKNDEDIQIVANDTVNASKYTKEFNRQWAK